MSTANPLRRYEPTSMMGLHAKRELLLIDEDPEYAVTIVKAVDAFMSYGHSGGSAMAGIAQLTRLLQGGNLAPLTDDPDEWQDVGEASGGATLYQNRRNSAAFSEDGGTTYTLVSEKVDAIGQRPVHKTQPRTTEPA